MDEYTCRLVRELCTRAGMIMEDASAVAVLSGKLDDTALRLLLAEIKSELAKAKTITDAANILANALPN